MERDEPTAPEADATPAERLGAEGEGIAVGRAYSLHPAICYAWVAHRLAFWAAACAGFGLFYFYRDGFAASPGVSLLLSTPVPLLVIACHLLQPLLAYRYVSYELREHDFVVRRGVLNRRTVAIPLARIQQVDSRSGPLGRLLGHAEIVIHTAGTRVARTVLDGVPVRRAEVLRNRLSKLGNVHAGE